MAVQAAGVHGDALYELDEEEEEGQEEQRYSTGSADEDAYTSGFILKCWLVNVLKQDCLGGLGPAGSVIDTGMPGPVCKARLLQGVNRHPRTDVTWDLWRLTVVEARLGPLP